MFEQLEISLWITQAVKAIKGKKKDELPLHSNLYVESVAMADKVAVHADGLFPYELMYKKAPNESLEEFEYRQGIYKARTMAYWDDAMSTIGRIWNPSNFKVSNFDDSARFKDGEASTYFLKDYPTYNSLLSFFSGVVTDWKIKDPNAVLAVKPRKIPEDETELLEPVGVIYGSRQVINSSDEHTLILLDEYSLVKVGNTDKYEGLIFEFYDKQNIWRITQTGTKRDFTFEYEVYYAHELGVLPVSKLRGVPIQKPLDVLYKSYFYPSIPNLDAAALNYSNLDMAVYSHVFPQRWEIVERCTAKGCVDGVLHGEGGSYPCNSCNGTGQRTGPTTVKQIEANAKINDNQALSNIPFPPMGYVSPDSNVLEFLNTVIQNDLAQAFLFLNIPMSNTQVQGTETALGKMIDREELFSLLLRISNELFILLKKTVDDIGKMRYGQDFESPEINPPVSFEIRSEQELMDELAKAKDSNLPLPVIQLLTIELIRKRFNNDKDIEKIIDVVFHTDSLALLTEQEISMKLANKTINKWEAVLHKDIFIYLNSLDLDSDTLSEQLIELAKAKSLELEGSSTQSILDDANASPITES